MPDFAVSTGFTARDRISTAFRAMGRNAGLFENKATKSFRNVGRAGSRTGDIMKGILGADVLRRGFRFLTQGLRTAVTEFISFDQTIVGATARFKDLEIETAATVATMEKLKQTAREVGAVTQFTATEAAAGLNFFAKAGFTSTEAMGALKTQIDLATVAELDLARTSDITSDLLGALGLNAADSSTKIANLERLSNSLGLAANAANVTLEDMFETLKVAAPIATAAGEKMNPLIAITASLGSAGIKGSQAATALKNAYINLATNAPAVADALASVGLAQADFVDQETGTLDMVAAMQLLGDATKGLGNVDQLAIFSEIFGKRAVAGAVNIAKSLAEIENITRLLDSDKRISAIADEIRTGLGMQVKILKSSMIELGFKFIQAFEKDGRGVLSLLIEKVQQFDVKPIVEGVGRIIEIIKKWGPVVLDLAPMILGVAAAIKIMNIAMNASPIGLFLTTAAALVGTLGLLEKKFGFSAKISEEFGGSIGTREFEEGRRGRLEERRQAAAEREAPNKAAAQAAIGRVSGLINIQGLPTGSTAEMDNTGSARDIDFKLLGQN